MYYKINVKLSRYSWFDHSLFSLSIDTYWHNPFFNFFTQPYTWNKDHTN